MSKTLIYHGSSQIVETPEIRITHQISFHTAKALTTLRFVEGVEVQ